jgi:RHS repeat-associated protein
MHAEAGVGLSYAQQRWYDERTGRFLSEDPVFGDLGNPLSLHRWVYAHGNPLAFVDPTGEKSVRQLLDEAATSSLSTSENWATFYNVLHAGWDTVDAISFGTIAKLDTIEERVEAGDERYRGGAGEANYYGDILGTASVGLLKMGVAGRAGELMPGAVTPASTVVGRVAQGAGSGFLVMAAANVSGQAAENLLGQRYGLDGSEALKESLGGAVFGAGGAALGEVLAVPAVNRVLTQRLDPRRLYALLGAVSHAAKSTKRLWANLRNSVGVLVPEAELAGAPGLRLSIPDAAPRPVQTASDLQTQMSKLRSSSDASEQAAAAGEARPGTYSQLRSAGVKDAHHIIQDAAVKNLPGYSRSAAPAVELPGPSTRVGSPHYMRLGYSDRSAVVHMLQNAASGTRH